MKQIEGTYLRDSQRKVIKQSRQIDELTKQSNAQREKIKQIESDNCKFVELRDKYKKTEEMLKSTEKKKINAQKTASYYKNSAKKLKERKQSEKSECDVSTNFKEGNEIEYLELEVDRLSELLQDKVRTKNKDGSYSDNIRLCVIELTGLEVANEKVSPVISTVSKHLFGKEFSKEDLPSSKTVRTIVDEGHYVAKSFIAEKLSEASSWGLNRDGTTRKKHKLLDTTITVNSGDTMSLGFTRVHKETAVAIQDATKQHMSELAQINNKSLGTHEEDNETNSYVRTSLQKLAFSMCDRAANEKKANKLLVDWRNTSLQGNHSAEEEVLHFYCMAHVLLGFHTYTIKELQPFEKELQKKFGPLGRSSLKCFEHWREKGSVVERVCRTVSEVFGPVGDHHGARDLWEAFCATNGVKSIIGNYRHNRFNALFQTAAEILVHRQDFIVILESIKSPNLLLKSVLADLKSDIIAVLLQCLGLFYVKVTGPYWNLVANSRVPYLLLYKHITEISNLLDSCQDNPAEMFISSYHWTPNDTASISDIQNRKRFADVVFQIPENNRECLLAGIQHVAKGMKDPMQKQLSDFLPGGKFSVTPSDTDLARSSFAQVTNLSCEHHFGDLDSSQRRRPSATLHHHSSVQLIKRNRTKMMKWLEQMEINRHKELLKSARKGGKLLRDIHIKHERKVLSEIHDDLKNKDNKKRKNAQQDNQPRSRRRLNVDGDDGELESSDEYDPETVLKEKLPDTTDMNINEYVAVAYEDSWYPGIVIDVKDTEQIEVNFLVTTKRPGMFQWPQREDIQTVETSYILKRGFIPECANSGRLWKISEFSEIEKLYSEFRGIHFC